ncbi:maleylpyruvate isomerase family mycothiol-dependent enzyme [Actinomadura fibrosa]|uniref:Maleylpyruvate isomerase family mycothiol-dependent enzyme n=1 Tax=Actinomadura fibrosa TaxID=111802 RepID=A0ABW2XFY9_9ACTN|nr:maleylpyruvate isomerase family mycothiol-dependent enzyme [Actinomadura fibrosa]
MSATHEHVSSLLGAWALGACSDEETQAVIDHLAGCPACAEDSLMLGGTAELLGGVPPMPTLREQTLDSARARRRPAPSAPPYAAPYAAQVSMLDALLAEVSGETWSTNVIYDWSVQDVVAHLSATDSVVADQLDDDTNGPPDVNARTAATLSVERTREPQQTRDAWREQAEALCARLDEDGTRSVSLQLAMPVRSAIVARAFETWVHSRDIALATGLHLPSPLPTHLHAIASLGVHVLPDALAMREGRPVDGETVRVDLSGPGGGSWDLPLGPDAPGVPTVTLSLDATDFCLLAADRIPPDEVQADVAGDVPLGHRLLAAASTFAVP